ncbi:MAG: hypothetical protein JWP75_4170 [Frondihabitans sp.]|nr:hypothetical protein [Frondihabitans sp.]
MLEGYFAVDLLFGSSFQFQMLGLSRFTAARTAESTVRTASVSVNQYGGFGFPGITAAKKTMTSGAAKTGYATKKTRLGKSCDAKTANAAIKTAEVSAMFSKSG